MASLGFGPGNHIGCTMPFTSACRRFLPYGLLEPQDVIESVPANRSLPQLKVVTPDSLAERCFGAILNKTV